MFAIINVGYFAYGAGFAPSGRPRATSVACPYPFPEAKVYDPQGFYEEAGAAGPVLAGIWSGWLSAAARRPARRRRPADGGPVREATG